MNLPGNQLAQEARYKNIVEAVERMKDYFNLHERFIFQEIDHMGVVFYADIKWTTELAMKMDLLESEQFGFKKKESDNHVGCGKFVSGEGYINVVFNKIRQRLTIAVTL